jgi:hypothetical protein
LLIGFEEAVGDSFLEGFEGWSGSQFFEGAIEVFSSLNGVGTEETGLDEGRYKVTVEAVPVTDTEQSDSEGKFVLNEGDVLVGLGLLASGTGFGLDGVVHALALMDGV